MEQLQVVIADDEFLARENIRDLLAAHPEVQVVGEAGTVAEARRIIYELRPDAVFLDVKMPGGTGFDVFSGLEMPVNVVFVTAYDRFAVRAFQVNAIDYLLKPIDRKLLAGAVQRLLENRTPALEGTWGQDPGSECFTMDDEVLVRQQGVYQLIPLKTLSAIRAYRNYTEATDREGRTHLFRRSIKKWGFRLPIPPFLQLDRSLIINTRALSGWRSHGRNLDLSFQHGPETIALGRTASERFKQFIETSHHSAGEFHPGISSRMK